MIMKKHQISSQDPFPDDTEKIQEARKILGDVAKDMTDDELRDIVTEVKFLASTWLDEYERTVFKGKTLQEHLDTRDR